MLDILAPIDHHPANSVRRRYIRELSKNFAGNGRTMKDYATRRARCLAKTPATFPRWSFQKPLQHSRWRSEQRSSALCGVQCRVLRGVGGLQRRGWTCRLQHLVAIPPTADQSESRYEICAPEASGIGFWDGRVNSEPFTHSVRQILGRRSQPHQAHRPSPITSSRSRPRSQGSSSVNIVTHCFQEQGILEMSVPQNMREGPNASKIWRRYVCMLA